MYIYDRKLSGAQSLLKEHPITSWPAQRYHYPDRIVSGLLGCEGNTNLRPWTHEGWATIDSTALPKAQTPVAPPSLRPGRPAPLRAHPPPRQSASGWPACRQQVAAGRLRGAGVRQERFRHPKAGAPAIRKETGRILTN